MSLASGLVGGNSRVPFTPTRVAVFISQLTNSENEYNSLRFLEEFITWENCNKSTLMIFGIVLQSMADSCAQVLMFHLPKLLVTIKKATLNFK